MKCDAKIRPFPNPTELTCERDVGHLEPHLSVLRDYANPGSRTEMTWFESDRRNFRGEWRPCFNCTLPAGHRGNHAP